VISFNPLAGGLLSGKYRFEETPTEGRFSAEFGQEFLAVYHERYCIGSNSNPSNA
jgi:1-deoxyxylulose-5-phosphate synthase